MQEAVHGAQRLYAQDPAMGTTLGTLMVIACLLAIHTYTYMCVCSFLGEGGE